MPANGPSPSQAEALAAAIEGARAALEHHLRDGGDGRHLAVEHPLLRAYRELIAAGDLLKSRGPSRPVVRGPAGPPAIPSTPSATIADDLTRIRGIDAAAATRLATIGIHSFSQIAAWQPDDVHAIAQALEIGRDFVRHDVIEQAKMQLVARTAARDTLSNSPCLDAVATWSPHGGGDVAHDAMSRLVLSAEDLETLRCELRRGVGRNVLRSLADIAPGFAMAVVVPTSYFNPFETEAEWLPTPLIVLQKHHVEPVVSVGAQSLRGSDSDVSPVQSSSEQTLPEPALEVAEAQIAAPASPLHVAAVTRLDELEAEISLLGSKPVIATIAPKPERDAPATQPVQTQRPKPEPQISTIAAPPRHEADASDIDAEEADVTITVHRAKPRAIAAMPDLPLKPKRTAQNDDPLVAKPVPNSDVSEAAVVIVKRRAAERAAPDLEFYKTLGAAADSGPVRRLLRAVTQSAR